MDGLDWPARLAISTFIHGNDYEDNPLDSDAAGSSYGGNVVSGNSSYGGIVDSAMMQTIVHEVMRNLKGTKFKSLHLEVLLLIQPEFTKGLLENLLVVTTMHIAQVHLHLHLLIQVFRL